MIYFIIFLILQFSVSTWAIDGIARGAGRAVAEREQIQKVLEESERIIRAALSQQPTTSLKGEANLARQIGGLDKALDAVV